MYRATSKIKKWMTEMLSNSNEPPQNNKFKPLNLRDILLIDDAATEDQDLSEE